MDRMLQRRLLLEIDGVIHRYMEALQRFYKNGGFYPESKESEREVDILRRNADSVIAFIDDVLERDPDARVSREMMYAAYIRYCEDEDRVYPVSKRNLFSRLRNEGIRETQSSTGIRYFSGIKLG